MKVLILTNGEYGDYSFCKEDLNYYNPMKCNGIHEMTYDFIICADRGMMHALKLGITPNLIVGDFDSGRSEDLAYYKKHHIPIEYFKPEKDETDTEIAILRAIENGASEITIYGGIGSRIDHSLANIHLLYTLLERGIQGRLMNPNNTVYLINKKIILKGQKGDLVSLIPFAGEARGITSQNLGYSLKKSTLKIGVSRGISNYMTAEEATIDVEEGMLIVVKARD